MAVNVAPGNPNYAKVTAWAAVAWNTNDVAVLDDPGEPRFVSLDMNLASAMLTMLEKSGEKGARLRDRVNLKMEEAAHLGKNVIKGRQIVWTLLDSFKTFDSSEMVYGLIISLAWK